MVEGRGGRSLAAGKGCRAATGAAGRCGGSSTERRATLRGSRKWKRTLVVVAPVPSNVPVANGGGGGPGALDLVVSHRHLGGRVQAHIRSNMFWRANKVMQDPSRRYNAPPGCGIAEAPGCGEARQPACVPESRYGKRSARTSSRCGPSRPALSSPCGCRSALQASQRVSLGQGAVDCGARAPGGAATCRCHAA